MRRHRGKLTRVQPVSCVCVKELARPPAGGRHRCRVSDTLPVRSPRRRAVGRSEALTADDKKWTESDALWAYAIWHKASKGCFGHPLLNPSIAPSGGAAGSHFSRTDTLRRRQVRRVCRGCSPSVRGGGWAVSMSRWHNTRQTEPPLITEHTLHPSRLLCPPPLC